MWHSFVECCFQEYVCAAAINNSEIKIFVFKALNFISFSVVGCGWKL